MSDQQRHTLSQFPVATGPPQNTSAVNVFGLDSATETILENEFDLYAGAPTTCRGLVVPGKALLATIKASGVSWAVVGFQPAPGCYEADPGYGNYPLDQIGPWNFTPPPPTGLFERPPGGQWTINVETGRPFPCPPSQLDGPPGNGSATVPADVLAAWHVPYYSPDCQTLSIASAAGH